MKVKVNRVYFAIAIFLIASLLCSGCVTAPSGITELGNEKLATDVRGDALYIGWYGIELVDKPGVYQKALKEAIGRAQQQGYAPELSDVKVWTTNYVGFQALLSLLPATIAVLSEDEIIGTLIMTFGTVLIGGLEVQKYTVSGVPVEK